MHETLESWAKTNRIWPDLDELKSDLNKLALTCGFQVSVSRTDKATGGERVGQLHRVTFGCPRSGEAKMSTGERPSRSTKCKCPFVVHANYLQRGNGWHVTKVDGHHNHDNEIITDTTLPAKPTAHDRLLAEALMSVPCKWSPYVSICVDPLTLWEPSVIPAIKPVQARLVLEELGIRSFDLRDLSNVRAAGRRITGAGDNEAAKFLGILQDLRREDPSFIFELSMYDDGTLRNICWMSGKQRVYT